MRYGILGSLEISADGATADLGPPKQRTLLAILLLHAGQVVPTERLIDLLWDEKPPRTATHSIQIYVSALRRSLEPLAGDDLIITRQPGYLLQADPDAIDACRFEKLVREGMRAVADGEGSAGAEILRSALDLWRGPPLADFTYEEFAQEHIDRLRHQRLDALEQLGVAELAVAELTPSTLPRVLPLLQAAVSEDPLRERLRELLMLALYGTGRHAEALRTYQRFREHLAEELGLDPSPNLQRLQERILLHDPTLITPPLTSTSGEVARRNPYKGLRPFEEIDAEDFFGRSALVERMLDELRIGGRLLAVVGPSGSGKSSAIAALFVPRVRAGAVPGSEGWSIVTLVPGTRPADELRSVLAGVAGDTLLIIDQLEEVFSASPEEERRFFDWLVEISGASAPNVRVVLALRADLYDRPLLHPTFAQVFVPGVISVLPMSREELTSAVVEPARRVGVAIEAPVLAELLGDVADQPGALPLLQYALTELFDGRSGDELTLDEYREIGGIRGALSRRAETLFEELDRAQRAVARQVFLRFVRLGQGAKDLRRRVPIPELTALDVDAVSLSVILERFSTYRLLTFDRDQMTRAATIMLAHEALLTEWSRLAGWIDRHREALGRHASLVAHVGEWEAAGCDPDYLLSGKRLDSFASLLRGGPLLLTSSERGFLEESIERRRTDLADKTARAEAQRKLEGRSRRRLRAIVATVTVAIAAVSAVSVWGGGAQPTVALLNHGAESDVDQLAEAGFDRAVTEFDLVGREMSTDVGDVDGPVRALSEDGAEMVVVQATDTDIDAVARDFPRTRYAVVMGESTQPNVSNLAFADHEGSYLIGAAAALTSTNGTIGFIGGVDVDVIHRFQAGFEAGARAADPDVRIMITYLTAPPDYRGYFAPKLAKRAARRQYGQGADVIFGAAGFSVEGVFEAAATMSGGEGPHLWALGVDVDAYQAIRDRVEAARWRPHILSSMVKHIERGVYLALADHARGAFSPGSRILNLANGGVGISYRGGFLDDIRPRLEALRSDIVAGKIKVPERT